MVPTATYLTPAWVAPAARQGPLEVHPASSSAVVLTPTRSSPFSLARSAARARGSSGGEGPWRVMAGKGEESWWGWWWRRARGEECDRTRPPSLKIRVGGTLGCVVAGEALGFELGRVRLALRGGGSVGRLPLAFLVHAEAGEQVFCALLLAAVEHGLRDVWKEQTLLLDDSAKASLGDLQLTVGVPRWRSCFRG